MRGTIACLVILLLIVLFVGFEKSNHYKQVTINQASKITELQSLVNENLVKTDNFQVLLNGKMTEINRLSEQLRKAMEPPTTKLDLVLLEIPWLQKLGSNTKWDHITISRYEGDPAAKKVEDPLFLKNVNWLLHLRSVGTVSFSNGYHSDIDNYTYDLYQDGNKYSIKVIDRGVIEIENQYFEVDEEVHLLGAAFMPKPPYIKHDGLIAKMAASGAVNRDDQYVHVSGFRTQLRVSPLTDAKQLNNEPGNVGGLIERNIFYYYGQKLVMEVFKDHAKLSGDGELEWYYIKNAGTMLTVDPG